MILSPVRSRHHSSRGFDGEEGGPDRDGDHDDINKLPVVPAHADTEERNVNYCQ